VAEKRKPSRKVRERRAAYSPKSSPSTQDVLAALGDLVMELDVGKFPPQFRPWKGLRGREALRKSLPRLTPPLSATIIEERAE
jgi:hypothetical protein